VTDNGFLDGDKFPNRPDHLDFWRMSDVVLRLDGAADNGRELSETADGVVDLDSLVYMAEQRCALFAQALKLPTSVTAALVTVYVASFLTGVEFEKEGGHR
jgi:hypothetical protein